VGVGKLGIVGFYELTNGEYCLKCLLPSRFFHCLISGYNNEENNGAYSNYHFAKVATTIPAGTRDYFRLLYTQLRNQLVVTPSRILSPNHADPRVLIAPPVECACHTTS
jgi:hypothetical protein